ncbi:MAG: hypothetical protein CVT97_03070 [Bacteroidetes bacterium HGW-Bacteroidetes-14]|jgi:predicted amidohydrolase|nr:MAG: hypothetical protein CVT97_03070 [Bacteroidetes bacterium HGW-Bacteroidetes-14]
MKIALCNIPVQWESPEANLELCSRVCTKIMKEDSGTDIIVFPEFFTYGFSMNSSIAENEEEGITLKWLKEKAVSLNVAFIAGVPVKSGERLYNRSYFVFPDGRFVFYDKRHLFSYGKENQLFSPGNKRVIVNYKEWNILLQICYDLRFPVWSRNVSLDYDIAVNIASWPDVRASVTEPMVKSRAIENLSYFAFLNRSGADPDSFYNGETFLADFKGNLVPPIYNDSDFSFSVFNLDKKQLFEFRNKFPAWKDADEFNIIIK